MSIIKSIILIIILIILILILNILNYTMKIWQTRNEFAKPLCEWFPGRTIANFVIDNKERPVQKVESTM